MNYENSNSADNAGSHPTPEMTTKRKHYATNTFSPTTSKKENPKQTKITGTKTKQDSGKAFAVRTGYREGYSTSTNIVFTTSVVSNGSIHLM
ncbi:hypothetical protein K7432_008965 [Basidiobolus ranarum]|uniref:Uncharacterized protein n=1 Tax=Basidiobolus ranarum TaxID=34480 RepID=A0ABR2WR47_9FUNG